MRKFVLILLYTMLTFILYSQELNTASVDVKYKSITKIDIIPFGIDSSIINSLQELYFIEHKSNITPQNRVFVEFECVSINQMIMNGKSFEIYTAKIKGKLTIIDIKGLILFSKDIDVIKNQSSNTINAEIETIKSFKEKLQNIIKDSKDEILAKMKL